MHIPKNCAKLHRPLTVIALLASLTFGGCGGGGSTGSNLDSLGSSTGESMGSDASASPTESTQLQAPFEDASISQAAIEAAAQHVMTGESTPEVQALALKTASRSSAALDSLVKLIVSAVLTLSGQNGADAATGVVTTVTTAPTSVTSSAAVTPAEASRFLIQATFGPNMGEITDLSKIGYEAWLTKQFDTPAMDTHWAYAIERKGPIHCNPCDAQWINAVMESFWYEAVQGPDQLRQRMTFALSEIFVTSAYYSNLAVDSDPNASYLDMLSRNAFGNFRTLLEQVATHPAMGNYLSHFKNEKEDSTTGRLPDENFAREVMQLFTVGLWQLNPDGSLKKDDSGNSIPTYSQADVMGMAKVFTGWSWGNGDWEWGYLNPPPFYNPHAKAWNLQMQNYPEHHSRSEKRILSGVVIPANTSGPASLKIALDTLFNHPNVGPFIGSQLIKRFVTSNPSPAYVGRVTAAFNDNGSGVRGDMKALIRAVLLDPEARSAAGISDPTFGKLREPIVRYANFMRAFNVRSSTNRYKIWNTEDGVQSLGQNPLRSPSVFNWYRPTYAPPGTISTRGLVAPEFQITDETTTTGYANFIATVAERNSSLWLNGNKSLYANVPDYLAADYSTEIGMISNPTALVDRLNLLLAAGQLSSDTRKTIVSAVSNVPADHHGGLTRVATAITFIMLSPEYIVQK